MSRASSARPVELVGRGAGITTHPELLEAVNSGAGTHDLGITVKRRSRSTARATVIADKPLPQVLTSWDRLQRLLGDFVPAEPRSAAASSAPTGRGEVVVHFTGGRRERADLVIGGDGIRSGVRARLRRRSSRSMRATTSGAGAPNEADLAPEDELASIFPHFTFYLPEVGR